jgi:hypothetical protein
MKTTVTFRDFVQAFKDMDRENQFSIDALNMIFEHIEQIEDETGEDYEFDVIAICCEYAEATWQEIANDYLLHEVELDDEQDHEGRVIEYLEDEGVFIGKSDESIVYRQH